MPAGEPVIVLPGPWPGHPHPFKHVRVYDAGPHPAYKTCTDCPKSMLCMAGKQLFSNVELHGRPPPKTSDSDYFYHFTICAHCDALLWFEVGDDMLHICYALGKGMWARPDWRRMTTFGKESLSRILMAATGKSDPDLVSRFFRRDNLCKHYDRIVGDCARLYVRFLRQRAYLPDEIRMLAR